MKISPKSWLLGLSMAVLLVLPDPGLAQQGEIVGRVIDGTTREPVRSALILLANTSHQTTTDSLGYFRLAVPVSRYNLQVRHIGYAAQTVEVSVQEGPPRPVQISVSATAISLAPMTVDAMSADERRERATGYRRSVLTRAEIEKAENTNLQFGELLRLASPNVRVRRVDRMGTPVCIELRTIRAMGNACLSPAVYLDGVPINSPTWLYDNLPINTIEKIEIVPANEAGVMFGSGALYGAILITTIQAGNSEGGRKAIVTRSAAFDWSQDSQRHSTTRVFGTSALGNSLGLAIGVTAAAQCLGLRKPGNDGIVSDCEIAPTLGAGAAAIVLPALASGFASRWAGRTDRSQGNLGPAAVGAAMTVVPGYALVLSGYRNDSDGLKWIGYGVLAIGTPLVATAADYLFRKPRKR